MVKDKKFAVAIAIIIVLALALIYILLIGPKIQSFFLNTQIKVQQQTINALIEGVKQQGSVGLTDGTNQIVCVKYEPPQQEQPAANLTNTSG
ncbi:hypothetical protein HYW74_03750 [Candidatus Pacearchaeota archaeon]|nr:hypothetical protein [Candidatus Pacearchaeota archaeon]